MSHEEVKHAARMWSKNYDTWTIAKQMCIPECTVYTNLWRIRAQAARYRMTA